jgi:hypothetical protein
MKKYLVDEKRSCNFAAPKRNREIEVKLEKGEIRS